MWNPSRVDWQRVLKAGVCALAMAGLCGPAIARQEQPKDAAGAANDDKAMSIIKRAAEVVQGAKGLKYSVTMKGAEGILASAFPPGGAQVLAVRSEGAVLGGWLVRATGEARPEGKPVQQFDVAWRQTSVEFVDHDRKRVAERTGRNPQGPGAQLAGMARLQQALAASPFAKELAAKSTVMEAPRTIGGEECHVVLITNADGRTKYRWAFAQTDGFPRLSEQVLEGEIGGNVSMELGDVSIETSEPTSITPDQLRVVVPEGYTEDRPGANPAKPSQPVNKDTSKPRVDPPKPADPAQPKPEANEAPAPEVATAEEKPGPEASAPAGLPRPAPDFELSTPQGEKVRLSDLKGTVVVAEFFGSWCLPCRDWHARLAEAAKDKPVKLLALSVREKDDANAEQAIADSGAPYQLLLGAHQTAAAYGVRSYPATVIIDKDGLVIKEFLRGEATAETLTELGDALPAAAAPATAPS